MWRRAAWVMGLFCLVACSSGGASSGQGGGAGGSGSATGAGGSVAPVAGTGGSGNVAPVAGTGGVTAPVAGAGGSVAPVAGTGGSGNVAPVAGTGGVTAPGGGGGASGGGAGSAGSGIKGMAILTVPFTGPGQTAEFLVPFGYRSAIDLSAASTLTFRLCAAAAPDPTGSFVQPAVKNEESGVHTGASTPIATIAACPTMSNVTLDIAGGTLDAKRVNALSLKVGTSTNAAHTSTPTVLYLDAITVTNDVIGPYEFTRNTDPLSLNDTAKLGATITASPPDAAPSPSAGGALLTIPATASSVPSRFGLFLGNPVDLSGAAARVTYRMCMVSPTGGGSFQLSSYIQDANFRSSIAQDVTAETIGPCPTLTSHSFEISGGVDETQVFVLALEIRTGTSLVTPSQLFIDSISVTNDLVGPYDFTFNRYPMQTGSAGAAVEWVAAPPAPKP